MEDGAAANRRCVTDEPDRVGDGVHRGARRGLAVAAFVTAASGSVGRDPYRGRVRAEERDFEAVGGRSVWWRRSRLITSVLPKVVDAIAIQNVSVAAAAVSVFATCSAKGSTVRPAAPPGSHASSVRSERPLGDAVAFVSALALSPGAVTGSGSIPVPHRRCVHRPAPLFDDLLGGIRHGSGISSRRTSLEPVSAYFAQFFEGRSFAEGFLRLVNDVGQKLGRTITGVLTDPNVLKVVGGLFAGLAGVAIAAVTGLISGVVEKLGLRLSHAIRQIPIFGDLIAGLTDFIPGSRGALQRPSSPRSRSRS